jgi:hypothetical protein
VAWAASHREAPLIALDPAADLTDVYFFRSWVDPSRVIFIANVIPGQEPSAGPNYYNFADDVLYAFHVDVDGDGKADDIVYEVRFTTEIRPPFNDLPVAYAGNILGVLPQITALDGPGSEGIGLRQRYTVTEVRGSQRRVLGSGIAVPSNLGSKTIRDYELLAARGIFPLANGGRVFAGQRDETFYIDLGATFDTLNLRRTPPVLTVAEDANDGANPFGIDHFSGFNVTSIAIEVPISELTASAGATLGMYASTSRQRNRHLRNDGTSFGAGNFVQVARMANPLVNELIIGTGFKDLWNATDPENEAQFLDFYLTSRLATVINLVYGTGFPTAARTDLVGALLKYPGQDPTSCSADNPCSELLRLNVGAAPRQPADQRRLSVLAGDPAGWPNGRRPNDDVTDIALRVVSGVLLGVAVPNLGDGVNFNVGAPGAGTADGPGYGTVPGNRLDVTANGIAGEFPFLPTPHDGRNRRHIDCVAGAGPNCSEPPTSVVP